MNPDRDAERRDTERKDGPPVSPYGPHPRGVDEASGGADSSPHETEPTGERKAKAEAERRLGRDTDPADTANESP